MKIDKGAAERFIKHAITQSTYGKTPADEAVVPVLSDSEAGPSTARLPVKVTSKMLERAQYEKEMRERDEEGSEEDDLEMFEDEDAANGMEVDPETVPEANGQTDTKGKGRAQDVILQTSGDGEPRGVSTGQKRRRPAIDPFTGQRMFRFLSSDSSSETTLSEKATTRRCHRTKRMIPLHHRRP